MKPKILNPELTAAAAYEANPVGILGDALSVRVKEKLNGAYYAEIRVPVTSESYSLLTAGALLLIKPNQTDAPQIFRIVKPDETPLAGVATFTANHISYDLSKTSVIPFTTTGAAATVAALNDADIKTGGDAFTVTTDLTNETGVFKNEILQSVRSLFGGQSGSLLDVFGGEYYYNNFTVSLLNRRGEDRNFIISYGKNLTDYRQEKNLENLYTAARAFAKLEGAAAVLSDLQTIVESDEPKIKNVDFSDRYELDETPTTADLNTKLTAYLADNDLTTPKINIKISFVNLADTEEYKDVSALEFCGLGDDVTVRLPAKFHGMTAAARVIEYEYDALQERYNFIEIGDARATLAEKIVGINNEVKRTERSNKTFISEMIARQTEILTGVTGGNVVWRYDASGRPYEVLFLDTDSETTAQHVLRLNHDGIGFSSTGVNGTYSTAWTIDGSFNASFITSGIIQAIQIIGSAIQGANITGTTITGSNIRSESSDGKTTTEIWAGLLKMLYDSFYRCMLFTSSVTKDDEEIGVGVLSLFGGDTTDGNDRTGLRADFMPVGINGYNGGLLWQIVAGGNDLTSLYITLRNPTTGDLISYIEMKQDGGFMLSNVNHYIEMTSSALKLRNANTNTSITLDDTTGLGIYINGSGYTGLGFVNDGNGHAVLGK